MTMSISVLLTEEEFLRLLEVSGKQELLDGELIEVPPATHSHSELVKSLVELLHTALHKSRVWTETAYRLRGGRLVGAGRQRELAGPTRRRRLVPGLPHAGCRGGIAQQFARSTGAKG